MDFSIITDINFLYGILFGMAVGIIVGNEITRLKDK